MRVYVVLAGWEEYTDKFGRDHNYFSELIEVYTTLGKARRRAKELRKTDYGGEYKYVEVIKKVVKDD